MIPLLTGLFARRGRLPFPALCTLAVVLAAWGGLTVLGLTAHAADPVNPLAGPPAGERASDVVLARAVVQAFDADPVLREATLVVSVVDGVAVIGGPVPTTEAARRAGELVGAIRDIKEVRNKCFVQTGPDPLLLAMVGRFSPAPRVAPFGLPGIVSSPRTGVSMDEPVIDPVENSFAAADPGERSVVVRRPANPGENVLLPPVGLSGPRPAPRTAAAPPTLLMSVPPVAPVATFPGRPAGVLHAAEDVRKADHRFDRLALELRDGILVITGSAARSSDAWDLSQELRRIPGVARVAVGRIEVP